MSIELIIGIIIIVVPVLVIIFNVFFIGYTYNRVHDRYRRFKRMGLMESARIVKLGQLKEYYAYWSKN